MLLSSVGVGVKLMVPYGIPAVLGSGLGSGSGSGLGLGLGSRVHSFTGC